MAQLVRLHECSTQELADPIFLTAFQNKGELKLRYSPGTARRLGTSVALTLEFLDKAMHQDAASDPQKTGKATYAILPESGAVDRALGLATMSAGLKLHENKLPLSFRILDRLPTSLVRRETLMGDINVTGWIDPAYTRELDGVYSELHDNAPDGHTVWTIEPVRSNGNVHQALSRAGMAAVGVPKRYDLQEEDRNVTPPISQAYVFLPH